MQQNMGKDGGHLCRRHVVLLSQDFVQGPKSEALYMSEFAMPVEEILGEPAAARDLFGHLAKELNEERKMILIPADDRKAFVSWVGHEQVALSIGRAEYQQHVLHNSMRPIKIRCKAAILAQGTS